MKSFPGCTYQAESASGSWVLSPGHWFRLMAEKLLPCAIQCLEGSELLLLCTATVPITSCVLCHGHAVPHFAGGMNRVTLSFCCSPFCAFSKASCSHRERDSWFYRNDKFWFTIPAWFSRVLQCIISLRGDFLGLTSPAPVRTRVLLIKLRSAWC